MTAWADRPLCFLRSKTTVSSSLVRAADCRFCVWTGMGLALLGLLGSGFLGFLRGGFANHNLFVICGFLLYGLLGNGFLNELSGLDGDEFLDVVGCNHLSLDVDAGGGVDGVGVDGDALLEDAGALGLAVVGDVDHTALAWGDGLHGVFGHCATATADGLMDDKRLVAGVREGEGAGYHAGVLSDDAKVMRLFLEGEFGSVVGHHVHGHKGDDEKGCYFFHVVDCFCRCKDSTN